MNATTNYQLNQWAKSDQVKMEDFNADNAKIDAAIKAVDAKADALAGSKADASALATLAQTVAHKGNCQIVTGNYVGTGTKGPSNPNTLTFSKKPVVVFLCNPGWGSAVAVYGTISAAIPSSRSNTMLVLSWTENSISWNLEASSSYGPSEQLNEAGKTYHYFALVEA